MNVYRRILCFWPQTVVTGLVSEPRPQQYGSALSAYYVIRALSLPAWQSGMLCLSPVFVERKIRYRIMDSDSVSEDAEDEGPTAKDEDPAAGDEGTRGSWCQRVMRTWFKEEEEAVYMGQQQTDLEDSMVYIDVSAYPPLAPLVQTPPSPEWTSATLTTTETEGFLTELGAQVKIEGRLIRDHVVLLEELSPALFERYDRDIRELFTRSGAVRDAIFS
ncbi:hypothetical protein Tco_1378777 [Tanacetum coccineum]